MIDNKQITDIREYGDGLIVKIGLDNDRPVIVAYNEAGYNSTYVDLIDVLDWVREHRPELLVATPPSPSP
jgi:TATA-binding protein-associated factor Taf7